MQGGKGPSEKGSWLPDMRKPSKPDTAMPTAGDREATAPAGAGGGGWLGRDHRNKARQEHSRQLEQQIATLVQEKESIRKELEQERLDRGHLTQDLKKYASRIQELMEQSELRKKEKIAVDTEAAVAKRDLKKAEARMGELLEQVQGLNAASKARNREMDDLKSMHYKALRDKEASFLQIQKKLADDYELAMDGQNQIRAKLEDEERAAEDFKRRAKELEHQLAKSDAKLKAAMQDLARAEKSLNVSRGLDDQVKGIDAAAAATWRDSRDEELKRQREEIATLEQEVQHLTARLTPEGHSQAAHGTTLDNAQKVQANLEAQMREMQAQVEKLQQQRDEAEAVAEAMRAQRAALEGENAQLQRRADALAAELGEAEGRKRSLEWTENTRTSDERRKRQAVWGQESGSIATGSVDGSRVRELEGRVEELLDRLGEMEKAKARADAKAAQEHSMRLSQEQAFMRAAGEGKEAEEAQRRCRALREEVEEMQRRLDAEVQRRKSADADLERAHKGWRKEKEELEAKVKRILAEREEERVSMSSANRLMQASVEAMKGDLGRSMETSREGDGRLRRTVQELKSRSAAREMELEKELQEALARRDALETELRRAEARAEEAESQVENLGAKVKTAEAKADEATARAERAEEEKAAAQEKVRESLEALAEAESVAVDQERSRDKLKSKVLDLEGAVQRAKEEAGVAAQKAQELEQQLGAKDEEIKDLKLSLEEARVMEAKAQAVAAQALAQEQSLTQEVTEMRTSLREMDTLSRKSLEADHLQSVVKSRDRSLQEAAEELVTMEQRLLAVEREKEEAKVAADAECQRLSAALDTAQKQLLAAEQEHAAALEDAEGSCRLAQEELERARAAAKSWEDEREAGRERCQMLQQMLDDATTRLQEVQQGKDEAQGLVERLQAEAQEAAGSKAEAERLQDALASAESAAHVQQTRCQELEAKVEQSEGLLKDAQQQIQQMERSVQTLEAALDERAALEKQLSEAQVALAEKEETAKEMQQQVEGLEACKVTLQRELEAAEERVAHAVSQGQATQEAQEALQAYQRIQLLLGLCALWKLETEAETEELCQQLGKARSEAEAAEWAVKLVGRDLEWAKQGLKERDSKVSGLVADVRALEGRLQESSKELKSTQAQLEKTKEKARAFYKALVEQKEVTLRVKDALAQATAGGTSLSAAAGAVARSAAAAEASFAALHEGSEAEGADGATKGKREGRECEGEREGRVAKVLRMDERSPPASKDFQFPGAETGEGENADEKAANLQRRLAELESAAAQDKDRLAKMYEDMVRAKREVEELSQQLAGRELVLSAVEAERSGALKKAETERQGLADAHDEVERLKDQVQHLRTELTAKGEGPAESAQVLALQEQVQQLEAEKGTLEASLRAARQEVKELKKELNSLTTLLEAKGGYTDVNLRVYHSPERPLAAAQIGEGEGDGAGEMSRMERTPLSSSVVLRASASPKGAVAPRVLFGRASSGTKPGSAVRMSESEILKGEFETERALARREVRNLQGELEELKQLLKEREQHIEALRSGLGPGPSAPSPRRTTADRPAARKLSSPMLPTLSAAAAAKEATFNVLRPKPVEQTGPSTVGLRAELSLGHDGGMSTGDASEGGSGTESSGAGASRVRAALEKFKKMEKKAPPPLPDTGRLRRRSSLGVPAFGNENAGWTAGRPPVGQGQGSEGPAQKRLSIGQGLKVGPPQRDSSPPLPTAHSQDSDSGPEVQPFRPHNGVRDTSASMAGAASRKSAGALQAQAEDSTAIGTLSKTVSDVANMLE